MRRSFFGACPFSVLRLQELSQQEKGRKRLSVPPSPGRHRQTTPDDGKVSDIIIIMQHHYNTHTVLCKSIYPLGMFCFVAPTTSGAGRGEGQSRVRVQHPGSLVDKAVLQSSDPAPQALQSPSWWQQEPFRNIWFGILTIHHISFLSWSNRVLWIRLHATLHLWYRMVKRVSWCFLKLSFFHDCFPMKLIEKQY